MGLFDELKKSIFGEATNPPSPRQQRKAPRIQKQSGPYEVILIGDGGNKVQSIKAVRAVIPSFGLKEAKEFVLAVSDIDFKKDDPEEDIC